MSEIIATVNTLVNVVRSIVNTYRIGRHLGSAKRIRIRVSAQNILNAIPNCPSKCAVALALLDAGYFAPRVGLMSDGQLSFTYVNPDGSLERWRYSGIPLSVVKCTYAVDAERPVEPFEFYVGPGQRYEYISCVRVRYAGGPRRGQRSTTRPDAGGSGRTMRRSRLQAALNVVTGRA